MFADAKASANMGGFASMTPAALYQLLLPLLLIIIGHGAVLRERESGTLAVVLAQGTSRLVWAALVLAVSTLVRARSAALGVLAACWLAMVLVVPRIGINAAATLVDAPGKIESDLVMLAQERKLGDGHN